ncbi:hypothetical protein F5887DRAFT_1196373 [Amanita rubescens]|nr:hypothetical protein F5887DRAFT_1196373 [Amanita rubescens]
MPSKNEEYYLEDTIFQVEDQLFKVHRHLFVRLSQVFRDMYAIPVCGDAGPNALSVDQPLVLEGIEKKDFIQLLRCLYPLQYGDHNLEFSLEEWQSVLKLALRYEMAEIKMFVVKKMTPLLTDFPSLQIHLARTYNIQSWLGPGLSRLVWRAEPLSQEDVRLVGLSDSLKICALREKKPRCNRCESCYASTHSGGFTEDELGQVFGIDLPQFDNARRGQSKVVQLDR